VIIFGGTEIPSNRTLLERNGVQNVMVSYWGLRKRGLPKTKPYLIGEHFEPHLKVWVDSGAVQADKSNMSKQELEEFAADYEEFISLNYDRIEGWVEFDSQVLGFDWILQQREAFATDPKLWVVWHEKYGSNLLNRWSAEYSNIAIPYESIESQMNLASVTRKLKATFDVQFHALATAKPDNLRQISFTSATTLSWLSPMRRGETIIWDGTKLVRYPKKMKSQGRIRYKSIVERAGLDFQKFIGDDTLEATKVAIWSYLQLEANTMSTENNRNSSTDRRNKPQVSDNSDDTLYTGLMEFGGGGSNNSDGEMRKVERTEVVQRDPSEVTSMPVMGYELRTVVENQDGRDVLKQIPIVQSNTNSLRQCDSCFVAANCPAFKPQSTCGFSLPVKVETPEQFKALNQALLEMQAQRVMFMRFQEELNGGYSDPNLSQEIDRYMKMQESLKKLDESKEFIQITAQRSASQGVLSAIFGDRVQAAKEMNHGMSEEQTTMIIRNQIEN
jgi:hypothetical protein